MSARNRQKYVQQDLTDDEDSDIENFTDDSRSRIKKQDARNRSRRNTEQLDLDYRDTEVISRIQKMKEKSKFIRERRSGSLTNWPTTKSRDSGSLTPSDDELRKAMHKHRKSSLTNPDPPPKRLLSDSASEKEKEAPKQQKTPPKITSAAKSDSASEKEIKEEEKAPLISESKNVKQPERESDYKPTPVHAEKRLDSEKRPLKVINNLNANLKTPNTSRELAGKKDESKAPVEKVKKEEKSLTTEIVDKKAETPPVEIKAEPTKISSNHVTPLAPPEDWECQHCTFVNEAAATVCTICCKTRVDILQQLPPAEDDIDINEINDSILQNENDKQKGKVRKISFLPGTKAH